VTLTRKMMWLEGMFLRQHHFQLQDQRTESLILAWVKALEPFYWGFSEIKLSEAGLASGKIALDSCKGAFRDGLPFSFPGDVKSIGQLELDPALTDTTIYLAAPASLGSAAIAGERPQSGGPAPARYTIDAEPVSDNLNPSGIEELVQLGTPSLRLIAEKPPRTGYESMPICRVREVTTDRRVVLDADFVPPVISADACGSLWQAVNEIADRFNVRADDLAGPYSVAGGASKDAQEAFMLLCLCNSWSARLRQICETGRIHPNALHRDFVEAAGALAAFTDSESLRPPPFPAYDHDDLTVTFEPVLSELRRALGALGRQKAVPIPLEFHSNSRVYHNRDLDRTLLSDTQFFLIASASMLEQDFRTAFPQQVSIGSTGQIKSIITGAISSVPAIAQSTFPDEIRRLTGWTPFKLDQQADAWAAVVKQGTIAIHAQSSVPDLELQLWAIRDQR